MLGDWREERLNQLILCQFDARRLAGGTVKTNLPCVSLMLGGWREEQLNQLTLCQFDARRLAGGTVKPTYLASV